MEIRKAEIPCEKRIGEKTMENKMNEQLTAIIHNTTRWMDLLFHECNGLFNNINWVSKMMLEEPSLVGTLPRESFEELNQTTKSNIHSFKLIQNYLRVMNAVAYKNSFPDDTILLNEAVVLTSVPKLKDCQVQYNSLSLKVSRSFAQVLAMLLNKMLQIAEQSGLNVPQISISFDLQDVHALHVRVGGSALFWQHDLWEQLIRTSHFQLSNNPRQWNIVMFYELLALIGGEVLRGCTEHKSNADTIARPMLATELIHRTISAQALVFCVPYTLEPG